MKITRRSSLGLISAALTASALPTFAQVTRTPPHLQPVFVRVKRNFAPGEIIVLTDSHYLYHVVSPGRAKRYVVAVGKEGLNFAGTAVIGRKAEWPRWIPTPEMIEREPKYAQYADGVQGGPANPLGARALYLFQNGRDTAFRIHGTNAPRSIGHSVSNGCIRMLNDHVIELYNTVPVGTKVTVI